jgi:hypothetical protein
MTRKERMLAAMRRQPVDRVPFSTYNLFPYAGSSHVEDPTYAPLLRKVAQCAGAFAKINPTPLAYGLVRQHPGLLDRRIEGAGDARLLHTILHTPRGDLTETTRIPENKPGRISKPFITSDADIETCLSLPYEPPEIDMTLARDFYASAGDRAVMGIIFTEPMSAVAELFDFEDFCLRCVTDLPAIRRMEDWAFERCRENLRRTVAACRGLDCILHTSGPELCTPPMLPPSLFGRLVTPYLRRLAEIIHDGGLLCGVHCHGRVREVFPELLKTGADLLEPIEPPDQGNITLAELMRQAGGRIGLMGHIQDQEFYTAPPGHMTRKVEEIARVVNGRTGYIMSPTGTPFERPCSKIYARNYVEWLEAADRIFNG